MSEKEQVPEQGEDTVGTSEQLNNEKQDRILLAKLELLETPMRWLSEAKLLKDYLGAPNASTRETYTEHYIDDNKEKVIKIFYRVESVFGFVIYNWFRGEYGAALKPIRDLKAILPAHNSRCRRAFLYLANAIEAQLLYKMGKIGESRLIYNSMSGRPLDTKELSYFFTLKLRMFSADPEKGVLEAMRAQRIATGLNPNEGINWFFGGKILSKSRQYKCSNLLPCADEILFLQNAVKLDEQRAESLFLLALAYSDLSAVQQHAWMLPMACDMLKGLLNEYEALPPKLITRCALKVLGHRDFELNSLENLVRFALRDNSSPVVLHQAGTFFIRIKKFDEALECFERAARSIPFILGQVLTVRHIMNKTEPNIRDYVNDFMTGCVQKYKAITLIAVSEYYLIKEMNPVGAATYFLEACKFGSVTGSHLTITCARYLDIFYLSLLLGTLIISGDTSDVVLQAIKTLKSFNTKPLTSPQIRHLRQVFFYE